MLPIHKLAWLGLAIITSLPRSISAECCYTVTTKRLNSSDTKAAPTFSVALSASSQFAVDTPGSAYFAQITFPNNFAIASIPPGCYSISSKAVTCTASGSSQWTASFPRIVSTDKKSTTPKLDKVVVNGEQCGLKTSCPILTPSSTITTPTNTSTSTAGIPTATTITTTPAPTSTSTITKAPPSPTPTDGTDPNNTTSERYSSLSTGAIVGLSIGLFLVLVLFIYCCSRRRSRNKIQRNGLERRSHIGHIGAPIGSGYRVEDLIEKGIVRPTNRKKNSVAFTDDALFRDQRSRGPYDARSERMTESSSYGGSAIRGARKTPGTTGKHKPTPSSSSTATYSGGRKLTSIPEEYGKSASYYDRGFYDYEHDPDAVTVEHRPVKSSNYDRASSRGSQTNKSWVTTIASRNSKLYRTVSNGFRRNSSQARSRQDDDYSYGQEYHQQPRYQETTPHPQDANTMTRQPSIARPPRSIHRPPSRSDLSYVSSVQPTGTYASSEIDYLDVGRRENPEYYYDGQSPSMMKNYQPSIDDRDRSRGIPRTYTEAYSIPSQGLPTQPPSPTMQQASPADRRGLKTPIHIRPQHHVAFLKEAMKSQDNHVAPYGYM